MVSHSYNFQDSRTLNSRDYNLVLFLVREKVLGDEVVRTRFIAILLYSLTQYRHGGTGSTP